MPPISPQPPTGLDRRRFLALTSAAGAASLPLPVAASAVLWAEEAAAAAGEEAAPDAITAQVLAEAEKLLGLELTPAERELMLPGLAEQRESYRAIREVPLDNSVPPAVRFDPVPPPAELRGGVAPPDSRGEFPLPPSPEGAATPSGDEELAFAPVTALARRLRERQVTSQELTHLYLERLKRLDPQLHAVVNLTESRALAQAERADREIAEGRWRGPLHGIPWGAKDLLAARGFPTTWGSVPFREQVIDRDAAVVERLDAAGAVLVAKLSLGELAMGDVWFGGMTRNPWNLEQGSSGSSAGSAAATVAGLVGFGIGSETLGSIVSPSTRTGATGLRPTFGRVSRYGAMTLVWSMDKLGPLCRSVEDCAAVFHAIHGADPRDPSTVERPFEWSPGKDARRLRVGYLRAAFEKEPAEGREEWHAFDLATLDTLRSLGIELHPIELPSLPVRPLRLILLAEAAAAFEALTVSGRDDLLVRQIEEAWPNLFRLGQTIPAVSYLQANRIRTLLMGEMEKVLAGFDAYLAPTFGTENLLLTNLTGHPAVVLPNGFRKDGTPTSITFTGRLFGEADLLLLAKAYQDATEFHRRRPAL
jgi:Asp-tRNA(Asn)/Glu-tRNA(Gln) amidotransferase A subunit family amidase